MIRILLFEDNRDFADGFADIIRDSTGMELVGTFENCKNAVQNVKHLQPDVILMDIDMPVKNGLEGLRSIREENISTPVLMLTVFDDNQNVFQAISNGANGYVLKKTPPARLLEYIAEANTGGAPMTASIATQVLKMFANMNTKQGEDYHLSDREKQVLQLLVDGYSYKMIAAEMFIAIDTVRSHIKKIYEKLHVNSKSEAVAKAFKDRII